MLETPICEAAPLSERTYVPVGIGCSNFRYIAVDCFFLSSRYNKTRVIICPVLHPPEPTPGDHLTPGHHDTFSNVRVHFAPFLPALQASVP